MSPEQMVRLKDIAGIREGVNTYITDNLGWKAADNDLGWSARYVSAKLAILTGQTMPFAELEGHVQLALSETNSDLVKELTAELIAEKICDRA